MTVQDVTYRKAGLDAFLADQPLTMKAEGDIAPGFDLGPDITRTDLPFGDVFPRGASGPTTLGDNANAQVDEGADPAMRGTDEPGPDGDPDTMPRSWSTGVGSVQLLDGYTPGRSLMMSADGGWLHKDATAADVVAPVARFRMAEQPSPSVETLPSLTDVHASPERFSLTNATGEWLGKADAADDAPTWPAPRAAKSLTRSGF